MKTIEEWRQAFHSGDQTLTGFIRAVQADALLGDIPDGWRLVILTAYGGTRRGNLEDGYVCDLERLSDKFLVCTNCQTTPAEALREAINKAKEAK